MGIPDNLRLPASSLDNAVAWLWTFSDPQQWLSGSTDDLPLEALLVCDVFWISSRDLMRLMSRQLREVSRDELTSHRNGLRRQHISLPAVLQ